MEFIYLFFVSVLLIAVSVAILKAYVQTYDCKPKHKKIVFNTEQDLFYFDGRRARNI